MKLFTVGPVEPYPCTRGVYGREIPYFRTAEYSALVESCMLRLGRYLGLEEDGRLLYFAASGTGAMEATVDNLLSPEEDKALVINGGAFGARFCQLLRHHEIPHTAVTLGVGEALRETHLHPFVGQGYTALLVNLHETSTGQLYDIEMLSRFCRENNLLLIVDAISTFMVEAYNMQQHGIDVTIFSSQKGLCLSAGMSFVALSKRALAHRRGRCRCSYFSFGDSLTNMERWQTPYTPAVAIMHELDAMLTYIEEQGGLETWLEGIRNRCRYFRTQAEAAGLSVCRDYPLSNMLTPLLTGSTDAHQLFLQLSKQYDFYVNPCGGELAHSMLRISHVGNLTNADADALIDAIKTLTK